MDNSILLVIVGGIISIISVIIGFLLQYFIERKKIKQQLKSHPSAIVYNKQIEFTEKINPILNRLNSYITTLDVWLGERKTEKVTEIIEDVRKNTSSLEDLEQLIEKFLIFLPSDFIEKLIELKDNCNNLCSSPNLDLTYRSINQLFEIQNKLRYNVGTDELSRELLQTFSKSKVNK